MDKKRKQFHGFGWFLLPTEGWKETAPWKRKFRFSVKVNIYLRPCICLKSENKNIENEGAANKIFWIFEILHFKMRKWMQNELTSPDEIYLPLIGQPPPWNQKYFDLRWKTQNSNSLSILTLVGGPHFVAFVLHVKGFI